MTPIPENPNRAPFAGGGGGGGGSCAVPELTMSYDRVADVLAFTSTVDLTMANVSAVRLFEAPVYDPANINFIDLNNDNSQLTATDEHTLVWANPFRDYFQQPQELHWAYAFNGSYYSAPSAVNLGPTVEMRPIPVQADIGLQGGTQHITIHGNYLSAADSVHLTGTDGFDLRVTSPFSLSVQNQPSPTDYNVSQWSPTQIEFDAGIISESVGKDITSISYDDANGDSMLLINDFVIPIT